MSVFLGVIGTLLIVIVLVAGSLAGFAAYTARRVEAAVPPTGSFIDVNGARVHYVREGEGPALLMIHGLGAQSGNFTHSLVRRLTTDFDVVVIDRPGSGYSKRPAGAGAGIRAQATVVAGLIRALELQQPIVVGHSLGGAIALAVAIEHPELAGGLALVAPVTQIEYSPPAPFRALVIKSPLRRWVTAWTVAIPAAIRRSRAVLEAVFAPDPVPRDYAIAGGGLLGLRPSSFCATSSDLVAANTDMPWIIARYPSLRIPVGIIFGRGDRVLDYHRHGEQTAGEIPNARLELIDGGHMLPLTAPDRVAAFVREVARMAERRSEVSELP